jgi:hypothetical protein
MLSGLALQRPDLDNAVGSIVRQVFVCIYVYFPCVYTVFPLCVYTRTEANNYGYPSATARVLLQKIMGIPVQLQGYCFKQLLVSRCNRKRTAVRNWVPVGSIVMILSRNWQLTYYTTHTHTHTDTHNAHICIDVHMYLDPVVHSAIALWNYSNSGEEYAFPQC